MNHLVTQDSIELVRSRLAHLTGQDLSQSTDGELASLATAQLKTVNKSTLAGLAANGLVAKATTPNTQEMNGASFLIVQIHNRLVGIESLRVKQIVPCCFHQKLSMKAGYFLGITRVLNQPMPLLDLAQLLGYRDFALDCQPLSLVLDLPEGSVALTIDEMVKIGPLQAEKKTTVGVSATSTMAYAKGHAQLDGKSVLLLDIDKLSADPTMQGLQAAGKRIVASERLEEETIKARQNPAQMGRVMTVLAGEEICLDLQDVDSVINLTEARLPRRSLREEPLTLTHYGVHYELLDLGDMLFDMPSMLDELMYALAVNVNGRQLALGVSKLLSIHVCESFYRVPRVGHRPPAGHGSHLQLIKVAGKGLIRRLKLDEIAALINQPS